MANRNSLTAERVRFLLNYDPLTGVFTNKSPRKKIRVGEVAGGATAFGRWSICIDKKHYCAGQLAWLHMKGEWPANQIDHKDRNPLNNKWSNLREATNKQNQENRSIDGRNKSGFKGVHWQKQRSKWTAQIRHNNRTYHLGIHDSLVDAVAARFRGERMFYTHGYLVSTTT